METSCWCAPYEQGARARAGFRELGAGLVVAGDGPTRRRIERNAPANVHFTGRVSDAKLAELYARCRALVYPQEEDFGIVAVEAQAAATPVIAFGRGGAAETVVPINRSRDSAPTGVWFDEPTPAALLEAIRCFESIESSFDRKEIRLNAERFSAERFHKQITAVIEAAVNTDESRPVSPN